MLKVFTSESVTDGHPDKICDQIADSILDEALRQDTEAHMAVEATIKDNFVFIYGEANTTAIIDYKEVCLKTLEAIGYGRDFEVLIKVSQQSSEINSAVNQEELGAGDQGIMFGYACTETPELMPLPITLAHKLAYGLRKLRLEHDWIKPDGKTQVSVVYENDVPKYVNTVLISTQHDASISQETIRDVLINDLILPTIDSEFITEDTEFVINPSGSFTVGGPFGDSGTTGRKIIVDTYGGMGRIGGGCFSSKDPSKVDRSAAYYARYVAKSVVAAGLATRFELQLSYAIGLSKPTSIHIDTFNTGTKSDEEIYEIILKNFNFSVANIINELDLKRPIYRKTATFGHFGRIKLPWEKVKTLNY